MLIISLKLKKKIQRDREGERVATIVQYFVEVFCSIHLYCFTAFHLLRKKVVPKNTVPNFQKYFISIQIQNQIL
jgi:hypothetical protein